MVFKNKNYLGIFWVYTCMFELGQVGCVVLRHAQGLKVPKWCFDTHSPHFETWQCAIFAFKVYTMEAFEAFEALEAN